MSFSWQEHESLWSAKLEIREDSATLADKPLSRLQPLCGFNILVVDDVVDSLSLMNILLTIKGASVEIASSAVEGVKKALTNDFDAILMDIQMPDVSGFDALTLLRRKNFRKPIIALTACAMTEEKNRALAHGFADHVAKPVDLNQLVRSILHHARIFHFT